MGSVVEGEAEPGDSKPSRRVFFPQELPVDPVVVGFIVQPRAVAGIY